MLVFPQTKTNAKLDRITVTSTLSVTTRLVHLIVLVFKDILEMEYNVLVWCDGSNLMNSMLTGTLVFWQAQTNAKMKQVDICDTNAQCNNTFGLFLCACNHGYSDYGLACYGTFILNQYLKHGLLLQKVKLLLILPRNSLP